jgi:hypothetical protein
MKYNMDGSNGFENVEDIASGQFYYLLFSQFLSNAPQLSGNLIKNITLEDFGDYWKITISGPTESGYDYAKYLNEKTTPTKTTRNRGSVWYQWVEKTIVEVANAVSGSVKYEL